MYWATKNSLTDEVSESLSRPTAESRWPALTCQRVLVLIPAMSETTRQYPERPVDPGHIMYVFFPMGEQTIPREQNVTRNPQSLTNSHVCTNNTKNFPCLDPCTPHTQNSVSDCSTPYRSFSFFDTLYRKKSFLWGTQYTKHFRFLYTPTVCKNVCPFAVPTV